jgi:hypothetical protein
MKFPLPFLYEPIFHNNLTTKSRIKIAPRKPKQKFENMALHITHLQKFPYPDLPAVIPQPPTRPWNRNRNPKPLPPLQRKYTSLATFNSSSINRRSNSLLNKLPTEILLLIICNLDRVTSACLGLTSYRLYLVHFSVHGKVGMKEKPVYTIEVLDGPWRDGGNSGFRMLGPMTTVKSSSLKQMLLPVGTRGRGGGREWDTRLGYCRSIFSLFYFPCS